MTRYTVVLGPNPGGASTVTPPALPDCITEGAASHEAVANARNAVAELVETLAKPGEPLPREESGPVAVPGDAEATAVAEVA